MKKIIQFHIYKGKKQFVAEGVDAPIVTQGATIDKLLRNISEAVSVYLEGEDLNDLNLAKNPSVLVNIELPVYA